TPLSSGHLLNALPGLICTTGLGSIVTVPLAVRLYKQPFGWVTEAVIAADKLLGSTLSTVIPVSVSPSVAMFRLYVCPFTVHTIVPEVKGVLEVSVMSNDSLAQTLAGAVIPKSGCGIRLIENVSVFTIPHL